MSHRMWKSQPWEAERGPCGKILDLWRLYQGGLSGSVMKRGRWDDMGFRSGAGYAQDGHGILSRWLWRARWEGRGMREDWENHLSGSIITWLRWSHWPFHELLGFACYRFPVQSPQSCLVVLNPGLCCPTEDIWQCPRTFGVVTVGRGVQLASSR